MIADQLTVAFQGEHGAFSESAARRILGYDVSLRPCVTFDDMFDAVRSGKADCCVTPIENSLAGSIHRNYDLMIESGLSIFGETNVKIVHNVIAAPTVTLRHIRRVYSHPVALAQCLRFFRSNPGIEAIPTHDTAGAVREVMDRQQPDEAAIASAQAAEIYGATIVARSVEDHQQNFTRFLLLAPAAGASDVHPIEPARRWKTSLMLRVADKPGALFRALGAFAIFDIDLSKIESRPIAGRPWEYAFYIDVIGRRTDAPLDRAISNLEQMADEIRVLGSYPTRW
ncbi:MAG TPA: prephenate dehydratase [Thermoanaerobaculia bacterium]|jgi:prephenate dehydratase|nr:prephenate dehydratase [Thermoanaerobaculia bacterium]